MSKEYGIEMVGWVFVWWDRGFSVDTVGGCWGVGGRVLRCEREGGRGMREGGGLMVGGWGGGWLRCG